MPSKQLLIYFAAAIGLMGLFVGGLMWWNKGSHIELKGTIQQIRLQVLDEKSTLAVADFRFTNPADYPFVVRSVTVTLEQPDGKTAEGMIVSEMDAQRIFDYYKLLGPKYNASLLIRDKVGPRQSMDRMIATRFEMTEEQVKARKRLLIRVEEVDGAVSEIVENK